MVTFADEGGEGTGPAEEESSATPPQRLRAATGLGGATLAPAAELEAANAANAAAAAGEDSGAKKAASRPASKPSKSSAPCCRADDGDSSPAGPELEPSPAAQLQGGGGGGDVETGALLGSATLTKAVDGAGGGAAARPASPDRVQLSSPSASSAPEVDHKSPAAAGRPAAAAERSSGAAMFAVACLLLLAVGFGAFMAVHLSTKGT